MTQVRDAFLPHMEPSETLNSRVDSLVEASRPTPIAGILRSIGTAVSALAVCLPMLCASRPRTPLRVLCVAAFEYLARLAGGTLGRQRRLALACACDFGSLRDGYYDRQTLDRTEYRCLRRTLRRVAPVAPTSRYTQQLRKAERGRPVLSTGAPDLANATIDYRASVIVLSLRWLEAICGFSLERVRFHSLVSLVCLLQLADDLLDWKKDQACGNPSYVTALLQGRSRNTLAGPLRAQADALLRRTAAAARHDAASLPFALAGMAAWAFVAALLKVRFPE